MCSGNKCGSDLSGTCGKKPVSRFSRMGLYARSLRVDTRTSKNTLDPPCPSDVRNKLGIIASSLSPQSVIECGCSETQLEFLAQAHIQMKKRHAIRAAADGNQQSAALWERVPLADCV